VRLSYATSFLERPSLLVVVEDILPIKSGLVAYKFNRGNPCSWDTPKSLTEVIACLFAYFSIIMSKFVQRATIVSVVSSNSNTCKASLNYKVLISSDAIKNPSWIWVAVVIRIWSDWSFANW
jgi:hypothetical protein